MDTFGKKIAALRKGRKMSQGELAKELNTSTSVIGRYERDEMSPSIEVAKKLAKILTTTVGYLLGETEQENVFKSPEMLRRFNEIEHMEPSDREHVLFAIDAMIQKIKLRSITHP